MRNFFCLISKADVPVYEAHLSPQAGRIQGKEDLMQFILHASLDPVDAKLWQTTGMSATTLHRIAPPQLHARARTTGALTHAALRVRSMYVYRYLRHVDRFNDLVISALVTPGRQHAALHTSSQPAWRLEHSMSLTVVCVACHCIPCL